MYREKEDISRGKKPLRLFWLLGVFAWLILISGANSIEVGFSTEDGGNSVGIYNDYEVSDCISINENAEAKFGDLEMTNQREVVGRGNLFLKQEFSGAGASSSYTAGRLLQTVYAQDLLDSSSANLKSTSFNANANTAANAAAGFTSTEIYGNTDRCFSEFFAYIRNGRFQNLDSMNIDNGVTVTHSSVYRAIGQDAYLEDLGIASNGGQPDWYRFTVQWGDPEPYIFGMDASAP